MKHVPFWSFYAVTQGYPQIAATWQKPAWKIRVDRGHFAIKIAIEMTAIARRFFALVDGRRTLGEIAERIAGEIPAAMPQQVASDCHGILQSLGAYDFMLLRHKSSPPLAI